MSKVLSVFFSNLINYVSWFRYLMIYRKMQKNTMIDIYGYICNLELTQKYKRVPGAIVECGTWRGGMIGGMAMILGKEKKYYLFDSFEGLPEAKEIDGDSAIEWQSDKTSKDYFDNCTASELEAKATMKIAGISNPTIVKGWFSESLPHANFNEGIAILRMDGDWYDSTMDILNNLFHQVNSGGVIIIDDYYAWDGCSRAVHDFLSANKSAERIRTHRKICYIVKI